MSEIPSKRAIRNWSVLSIVLAGGAFLGGKGAIHNYHQSDRFENRGAYSKAENALNRSVLEGFAGFAALMGAGACGAAARWKYVDRRETLRELANPSVYVPAGEVETSAHHTSPSLFDPANPIGFTNPASPLSLTGPIGILSPNNPNSPTNAQHIIQISTPPKLPGSPF